QRDDFAGADGQIEPIDGAVRAEGLDHRVEADHVSPRRRPPATTVIPTKSAANALASAARCDPRRAGSGRGTNASDGAARLCANRSAAVRLPRKWSNRLPST